MLSADPFISGFSRARGACFFITLLAARVPAARAQAASRVTRTDAVESALTRGARLGVAAADTTVAYAALITARAFENPSLSATYSKSTPQYHLIADIPLDYPWLRGARIGAAEAGRTAAQYRYQFERAAAAMEADTTYTRSLAARAHAQLARRNAQDADSLRRMAVARRDAGDAAELDVELATVNAGQQENIAVADSLEYLSSLLDLQIVMGLAGERILVAPADSLDGLPPGAGDTTVTRALPLAPLQVAAAEASLQSATLSLKQQHTSFFAPPSLTAGIETGDPSGAEPGILPTFGISIPLPLFNRNRGPIAQASAERVRAEAELTLARVQSDAEIARSRRELAIALNKVGRDQTLVAAAERVAAMSLTAYREGASTLPNVLEAQRNARDVLGDYVDDLANAWIASAELRVLLLTPASPVAGPAMR